MEKAYRNRKIGLVKYELSFEKEQIKAWFIKIKTNSLKVL